MAQLTWTLFVVWRKILKNQIFGIHDILFSDCDLPFTVAFVTNTAGADGTEEPQRGN